MKNITDKEIIDLMCKGMQKEDMFFFVSKDKTLMTKMHKEFLDHVQKDIPSAFYAISNGLKVVKDTIKIGGRGYAHRRGPSSPPEALQGIITKGAVHIIVDKGLEECSIVSAVRHFDPYYTFYARENG